MQISATLRRLRYALLISVLAVTFAPAAYARTDCSSTEKASAQQALAAYQRSATSRRSAFFKTHSKSDQRQAFVKRQAAKLRVLRAAAACVVDVLPPPAPPPPDTTPPALTAAVVNGATLTLTFGESLAGAGPSVDAFSVTVDGRPWSVTAIREDGGTVLLTLAPAIHDGQTVEVAYAPPATAPLADAAGNKVTPFTTRATNSTPAPPPPTTPPGTNFSFGDEMTASDRTAIQSDIEYAAQDEGALLGQAITSINVFVSTSPDWLAARQCAFYGHNDAGCISSTRAQYAGAGGGAAAGGPGGIFVNWAAQTWSGPAWLRQKILAHELFHDFQYQLDGLVNDGETPLNKVRAAGPVWLQEGAAELVGYRVTADRGLQSYAVSFGQEVALAKKISTPLDQIQTVDAGNQIPDVYSLYEVAADHLVAVAPAGLRSLTTYYSALSTGAPWQEAFAKAFGLTVDAYYADFAAYRSRL